MQLGLICDRMLLVWDKGSLHVKGQGKNQVGEPRWDAHEVQCP